MEFTSRKKCNLDLVELGSSLKAHLIQAIPVLGVFIPLFKFLDSVSFDFVAKC